MKTQPAYIVIDTFGRRPTISHVRARWPTLYPGQIVVRLSLEIPDALLPQLQEIELDNLDAMAVAVTATEVEIA